MTDTIAIAAMAEHVQTGTARPLLPDGVPGPVHYQGQWWDAPAGAHTYHRVTDPDTIAQREHQAAAYRDSLAGLAGASEAVGP